MSPPGPDALNGRERAWHLIDSLLARAQRGCGGTLLVEGLPGMGKTSLLSQAGREARARGFALGAAAADKLRQAVPMAPLEAAIRGGLGAGDGDGRDRDATGTWAAEVGRPREVPGTWAAEISRLRATLAERAARHPILVSLDDLQWADQATLSALRTLPRTLGGHRLLWILARAEGAPGDRTELLFNLLEDDGAVRVTLAPLAGEAVSGLLADGFGSPPDERLRSLAAEADGNPRLLSQLVQGLREEDAVRTDGGTARLVRARPPQRIQEMVRNWLGGLGRKTQQFLEITAVLGGSLSLDDAAAMISETPAVALAHVDEAMNAEVLTATAESLTFRCQLVGKALAASIPAPVRHALHQQYGEMLLDRGGPAADAATHLLLGARSGDRSVLGQLDQAAERVFAASPQKAADLAVRAAHLTRPADPARFSRSVAAAEALAAAGRVSEASRLIAAIPAQQLQPLLAARLDCARSAVSCLRGQARRARDEAQRALSQRGLPPWLRDEAKTARFQALAALGEHHPARRPAQAVLASPARHGEQVAAGSLVALAAIAWEDGRITAGLDLYRQAARLSGTNWRDARHFQPQLIYAARLIDLRQFDEAATIIQAAADGAPGTPGSIPAQVIPAVLDARINIARGWLDKAAAAAETGLVVASELGAEPYASLAHCLLATVALRRGTVHDAEHHVASRKVTVPNCADTYAPAEAALAEPLLAAERDGPEAAIGSLGEMCAGARPSRWVLSGAPGAAPWLARTAIKASNRDLAAGITRLIRSIADGNPEIGAVAAAAVHCDGILRGDPTLLAQAADAHADAWARALAAEDLAVLLEARSNKDDAVCWLTEALEAYSRSGATGDPARVRSRLRKLGVRPRHWANGKRSASGWDSLTETERTTAELVAEGLSNQKVAERMYVSVHTVAFHLRHVFRKLGIGSRLELARLTIDRSSGATDGLSRPHPLWPGRAQPPARGGSARPPGSRTRPSRTRPSRTRPGWTPAPSGRRRRAASSGCGSTGFPPGPAR